VTSWVAVGSAISVAGCPLSEGSGAASA